jgi:hypothetical protein
MKPCKNCKKTKPFSSFFKHTSSKDGFKYVCKDCYSIRCKKYESKNRGAANKRHRDWKKKNLEKSPWLMNFEAAKDRCLRKGNKSFSHYGGKGIKFLMSKNDFKVLWIRDHAFLFSRPSIDRINPDGNYELSNCRFIEHSENARRAVSHV